MHFKFLFNVIGKLTRAFLTVNHAIPANSHTCGLKTSISRRLTLVGQFLTPD